MSLPAGVLDEMDRIPVGARYSATVHIGPGPTQPPIQCVQGLSPGVNRSGRGVEHPPLLAPRLKKEWSYTCTPSMGLRGLFYGELYLYLYLRG
jgi:hypothetical protein